MAYMPLRNDCKGAKVSVCTSDVKIIILGTKKSLVLDQDEEFEVSFKKGEPFGKDIQNVADLIENARNTAYRNGDMLKSIVVDGKDIIESTIFDLLLNNGFSVEDACIEISSLPEFANADPSDLYDLVQLIASKNRD